LAADFKFMFGQTKKPIKDEKPLTIREQREADKKAEQKKRVNIFLSRSSGEAGANAVTGYQTSRSAFAGGEVESRSRVSRVGSDNGSRGGQFGKNKSNSVTGAFGRQEKTGFAQNSRSGPATGTSSLNKPPTRPLGFG
jgi:hypothetical protein